MSGKVEEGESQQRNNKSKQEYQLINQIGTHAECVTEGPNAIPSTKPEEEQNKIEFEFKIEGMTCVACSSSIERLMHNQFDKKGMESVSIVLLTHKMQALFP